jgi:hypothetical protein
MIAIIEQELGYRLYEAVGQVKRDLSKPKQRASVSPKQASPLRQG